jgi:hypothetical protein
MPELFTLAIITGTFLGLRFKAFVLCPAIVLAAIAMIGISIGARHSIGSIALDVVLVVMALQTGYVAGCIIRLSQLATLPQDNKSSPLRY